MQKVEQIVQDLMVLLILEKAVEVMQLQELLGPVDQV
tara:strand:- start:53 stop:163 length:111 start_codon:yes stop_codon:yes gene_type:complete